MRSISRYPGDPMTRYVVERRRRIPSHELMMLGMPELADFSVPKDRSPGRCRQVLLAFLTPVTPTPTDASRAAPFPRKARPSSFGQTDPFSH